MHTIAKFLRKKLVLAGIAAALVGSVSYAFAAGITITSSSLGAGNATIAACVNAISTSYGSAYDSTLPGYKVSTVNLTWNPGPNPTTAPVCPSTYTIAVTLKTGATATTLTPVAIGATDAQAGTKSITVTPAIAASTVDGISIAISS
jgi:hypothetical protein